MFAWKILLVFGRLKTMFLVQVATTLTDDGMDAYAGSVQLKRLGSSSPKILSVLPDLDQKFHF